MANIYLIKSDSYNLLNAELNKIIDDTYEVTKFTMLTDNIYDIIDDASYFGFIESPRAIIINNVKYFGGKFLYEEESAAILEFAKNLKDSTKVIFVCDEIKKTKDLTSKLIKIGAEVIDLSTKNEESVMEAINNYTEYLGVKVDPAAVTMLLTNAVGNVDIVLQEINKISIITKNITVNDIKTYSFKMANDNIFDFTSAVVSKNFDKAFTLLDEFLANGMDAFMIVGVLASTFTTLYTVKDAVSHGISDEEIAKMLEFKSSGRVYYLKKDGKIYTLDNLKEIIINLSELDKKIKTGYDPVYTIKEFLLGL